MAAFAPFMVGRHSCIGAKVAYNEMRLVLAISGGREKIESVVRRCMAEGLVGGED